MVIWRQINRGKRRVFQHETSRIFALGAGSSFLVKSLGAVLLLIAQIVAARLLGADEYGYFAYAQSVLIILTIFPILGYDLSLLRFVPEYQIQQKWAAFKGVLTHSFRLSLGGSVAASLLFAGLVFALPNIFPNGQIAALRVMLLSIPLYTLTMIRQSALRGLKHVVLAELPESVIRPVLFIVALPLVARMVSPLDAGVAWWTYLAVVTVTFAAGTRLLLGKLPQPVKNIEPEFHRAEWTKISLDMMWMNAMTIVFNQASIIFLGFWGAAADVALFSAAARIAFFVSFATAAISSIAAPMISELLHSGRNVELQRIMKLSAALLAGATLLTNMLLLAGGRQVLGLFGSQFREAYLLLLLLMLGHTFKSFSGPASYLLNLSGRQQFTRKMMCVFSIFHLLINIVLISRFGAVGAAAATTATMIVWNLALAAASQKFVGIDPSFLSLLPFRRLAKVG